MDKNIKSQKEKMLELRDKLRSIEDNRINSSYDCTIEELDEYLESVIKKEKNRTKVRLPY